ncbi:MAG: LysR family transcriptional regulator [Anaerolineae bacterium]
MEILETHSLRVFLEAARTLNFTEAGRALNISQPAVSQQIRALEEHLGVELFERGRKGLRLTRAGEALVPRAQQILWLVVSTEESVRVAKDEIAGDVAIGCSSTAGKYILPPVIARFKQQHPNVNISLTIDTPHAMMEGVVNGKYDLGVTSLRYPEYQVNYSPLVEDQLTLIVPATHPWARRNRVSAKEMLGERFICREPESACRRVVSSGMAALGVDIRDLDTVMEIGSAEALAMAVEHGLGVSFVSKLAALPRVALGRLAIVEIEGLELRNTVELVCSPLRPASAASVKFQEYITSPQMRSQMQLLADGSAL